MKREPIITTNLTTEELLRLALERYIEHEAVVQKQIFEIHEMLREQQDMNRHAFRYMPPRVA